MSRRRWVAGFVIAPLACAAWWPMGGWVNAFGLRELFRMGELAGWTPTGPGARLAGQILGFNYHQPPGWYDAVARSMAAAVALAPALLPALWLRRLVATGRQAIPAGERAWARGPLAALGAGLVFYALHTFLEWRMWEWMIALGEWMGGTVFRISGQIGVGQGGPFAGGTFIDSIANVLVRHGPGSTFAFAAGCAAAGLHTVLWRRDARAVAKGMLCEGCGYDLSGTPPASPCPECGCARRGKRSGTLSA